MDQTERPKALPSQSGNIKNYLPRLREIIIPKPTVPFVLFLTESTFSVPGTPVGGGITFEYQKAEGNGAIMMVDGEIQHYHATPLSTAAKWLGQNAASILKKFEDAQTNGIWVISSTHVAERRVLAMLSSHETKFSWTVHVDAANVGRLAPASSWFKGRQDGSWLEHEDVSTTDQRLGLSADGEHDLIIGRF